VTSRTRRAINDGNRTFVNPESRTVNVFTPTGAQIVGDVLPGFKLIIKALF